MSGEGNLSRVNLYLTMIHLTTFEGITDLRRSSFCIQKKFKNKDEFLKICFLENVRFYNTTPNQSQIHTKRILSKKNFHEIRKHGSGKQ